MSLYRHTVTNEEQGQRVDSLLAALEGVESRASAVRMLEQGAVQLGGEVLTSKKRIVLAGDELCYQTHNEPPQELSGEDIPLDIRYEDDDLIVLAKPAGLVCHPAQGHASGTLVNALIAHCGYDNLARLQGDDRPGIIHRLDKDTSGLMLAAKSETAGLRLQDEIRLREVDRRYLALVHGFIAPDTGLIDAPIKRGETDRLRMTVSDSDDARASVTTFEVRCRYDAGRFDDGYTLLECKLYTGRTHQIRVHMDYINHPCVGDPIYGNPHRPKAQLGLNRQFLHSWRLAFIHPISGQSMEFEEPLPGDLANALSSIADRQL
ncbi:MAG: RluA family pseudouridine synthase [Coriobacteriales bacterium]|jgi:23S rRNA pseudouridine1911/1915/1917 synthase|nr:RluA family pseudouridine synthase [Coriobacteriales bacterium]